ncbi:hypothetical protein GCM10009839_47940 [Catenulispora yoronensis]|uniref:DUF4240 domain-containing protein n=1 Tax=Catenulispora yoronensis TaxID=450799 RepID=A0ABN2UN28_9ACTN
MTTAAAPEHRIPTADEENRLWALVEEAWSEADDTVHAARRALITRPLIDTDQSSSDDKEGRRLMLVVDAAADAFIDTLTGLCVDLSSADLTDLDRVVERKLHDLDRADLHAVTDGSDDGFLYARAFILAVGRDYYSAVAANPRLAVIDCDLEAMSYLFAHVHNRKFGSYPETGSGISRETCANAAGWASS